MRLQWEQFCCGGAIHIVREQPACMVMWLKSMCKQPTFMQYEQEITTGWKQPADVDKYDANGVVNEQPHCIKREEPCGIECAYVVLGGF
jgi:hypothetical protein